MHDATAAPRAPRSLPASRGWAWITEAFALFKRAPGPWIGTFLLWALLYAVAEIVPLGGLACSLVGAVFQAGWMLGCRSLDSGGTLKVEHLFAAFKGDRLGPLILVGALYLAGLIGIVLIVVMVVGGSLLPVLLGKAGPHDLEFGLGLVLGLLVFTALTIPMAMAMWFAPALVLFEGWQPLDAMRQSFIACWRNALPFLLYGLIMLGLLIVALIPLGLGLLVFGPLVIASVYTSYRDIFGVPSAPAPLA